MFQPEKCQAEPTEVQNWQEQAKRVYSLDSPLMLPYVQMGRPRTPTLRGGRDGPLEAPADTDESGVLHGSGPMYGSSSGVIPNVLPSQPLLASSPVPVANAQVSAENVREIIELLKGLELRMQVIEGKVDKVLATSATITTIKNEVLSLKASVATVEGMITTMKIMDPSTPSNVPVEDIRKNLQNAPVIVSGPLSESFLTEGSDMISLDDLARPTLGSSKKITRRPEQKKDLTGQKLMLMQLANDCISKPEVKAEMISKIHAATNEGQLNDLKRAIIRSAV